jgi:Domain of unknown function in PX-proteins (DUF3818)
LSSQLAEDCHKEALEYLNIQLAIHDRKQIIHVLCHSQPDHLTQSIRDLVTAYEPVIRNVHKAVDLSETVGDFEHFLRDVIKMSKIHTGKEGKTIVPTVGDFIQLLRKHQFSCHKFIHQCCRNGKEVTSWYLEWARSAAAHFRREHDSESSRAGAGDLTKPLNEQFSKLPEDIQRIILPILDSQTNYFNELYSASSGRLASVLKSPLSTNPAIAKIYHAHHISLSGSLTGSRSNSRAGSRSNSCPGSRSHSPTGSPERSPNDASSESNCMPSVESDPGPGAFLAQWQDLLDSTPITPLTAEGPVRHGRHQEGVTAFAVEFDGELTVEMAKDKAVERLEKILAQKQNGHPGAKVKRPDAKPVYDAMLPGFREMLAQQSCYW